jgi:DNA-binding SARP family transcriptional activator
VPPGGALPPARGETAARLLGAAAGLRARCGAEVLGRERERHAATVAAARAALAPDAFATAWSAGEALSLDDVFALAAAAPVLDPAVPGAATPAALERSPGAGQRRPDSSGTAPTALPTAAHTTDDPAPALRVLALGPLVVARDGTALGSAAWHSSKVKELLLFLLLNPPRTKEQVGLALWPDASPAQLRNAFHFTLHHLRRALGRREWVAFDADSYRFERTLGEGQALDFDVDAVLAAVERARRAARRHEALDDAERGTLGRALGRFRTDLADGLAVGDWVVEHQDRVRAAWVEGMAALGRLHAAAGAHGDAADCYRALLARDPLVEGAHRELMRAYVAAGEPARALGHYQELVALLRREVGAAPARETTALADELRRGSTRSVR